MSVIIRMQNLPWSVDAQGIRRFFNGLSIPDGGVHIIGGKNGDAFITFSTDEDARRAMARDGNRIENIPIRLFLSSKAELYDVTVATYGTLLPLMGSSLIGQFSHLTEQSTCGSWLTGQRRSPTIPVMGSSFPTSVASRDWPRGIVRPLFGNLVPEPKRAVGIRPPSNELVFSERHSSDAGIGSLSAENSLQIFGIERGANKSSSLEISGGRQKSVEKKGGNSSSRMHEESAAKVTMLQNRESQDGLDKASLLKQFAKINDDLYQCVKKLAEHSNSGRPALGLEFLMTHAGSEFMSGDDGHNEFGHPEFGKEGLAGDISHVSHVELFRSVHDPRVSGRNENEGRTIKSLFTGDVSHIVPSGAMESRATGNRDTRSLRPNTVARSDLNPSFPGLGFTHSASSQGLDPALLNDIRLGDGGSSPGLRNDNHGFGTGEEEWRLHGAFGHNERRSQIGRNIRDEKPSADALVAPGIYAEIVRQFANVVRDVKARMGERQPYEISGKDIFPLRGGCGSGLWICVNSFPLSYGYREFRGFFSGRGIPVAGLKLVADGFGKPTGLAYVKFNSHQATAESLKLDGRVVDGCRVAVERCSETEYEDAIDNRKVVICMGQGRSRSRSPVERHIWPDKEKMVCAVVKNLSSETTTEDIREYFDNSVIAENGGPFIELDSNGRPRHTALVQFNSARDFEAAIRKNRHCSFLNGAAVRVIEIKTSEFSYRLRKSRVCSTKKNAAL